MTNTNNWKVQPSEVFAQGSVVPVLVIENIDDAVPIAKALIAGGINVLEVTLRTENALAVIKKIATELPDAMIGAGTVTNAENFQQAVDAGSKFVISPGLTPNLLKVAKQSHVSLIPGIASISELMIGMDAGYDHFKFFPAEALGGLNVIKAISGPFPNISFCPTGGINLTNMPNYLAHPSVKCVGGSWLVPKDAVATKDWNAITELAKEAVKASKIN